MIFVSLGPFVATCFSDSLQKKHSFSPIELTKKWMLNQPFYFPSTFFLCSWYFLLHFVEINTFCCWTLRSFSKKSISLVHKVSSSYDSPHLVTLLLPRHWYILSIPLLLYNFDSIPCSDAILSKSFIVLVIQLSASANLSRSLIFQSWPILLISVIFFFRSNLGLPYAAVNLAYILSLSCNWRTGETALSTNYYSIHLASFFLGLLFCKPL